MKKPKSSAQKQIELAKKGERKQPMPKPHRFDIAPKKINKYGCRGNHGCRGLLY